MSGIANQSADKAKYLVLTIVTIEFVSGFTQGFYEPLIPKFGEVLSVDASGLTLFNVLPTAIAALFVPIMTRLGDIFGYRKMLRLAITLVFVATLVIFAGAALGSWPLVLFGRFLNGPIAVWLPLHIALVYAKSEGGRATSSVTKIIALLTVGTVTGTAVSGFVFQAFDAMGSDWFALGASAAIVPIFTFIATLVVWFLMPEFISGAAPRIDWRGFAGLGCILLLTIVGFVTVVEGGWLSVAGAFALAGAATGAFFWVRFEQRIQFPAVDTKVLFSKRLGPLYFGAVAQGAVFYGFLAPVATFLAADPDKEGYGFGFAPGQISIANTAVLVATVVSAVILPKLIKLSSAKASILLGFALATSAFLAFLIPGDSIPELIFFIIFAGGGLGLVRATVPAVIPLRAPKQLHGIATGLYNSADTLGGALGGGLFLSLLKIGSGPAGEITITGYNAVWIACAAFLTIGFINIAVLLTGDKSVISKETNEPE